MQNDDDLLTSAAKAIGTAIAKVNTTLHIAEPPPSAPAKKPAVKKKSTQKKAAAKKPAAKKPPAKQAATKHRK